MQNSSRRTLPICENKTIMIELKKMNEAMIIVNPDLIRFIEATPDTILTFTDGTKLLVRDSPQDIMNKIVIFRHKCRTFTGDRELSHDDTRGEESWI